MTSPSLPPNLVPLNRRRGLIAGGLTGLGIAGLVAAAQLGTVPAPAAEGPSSQASPRASSLKPHPAQLSSTATPTATRTPTRPGATPTTASTTASPTPSSALSRTEASAATPRQRTTPILTPSSSPAPAGWTYPTVSWDSGTVPLGETMALDLPTGWTARAIISAANTTTLTPGERTNAICVHDPANTDELGPRCDVLIQFGPHIQGYGGTPWTPGQTDAWWHIGPDMYSCIVKSPPSATLPLFLVGVPGPVTTGTGTIGAWPATTWTYPAGCIDEPGTAPKVTLTPKVWWNATHQIYADAELPSDRTTTLLATIRATR